MTTDQIRARMVELRTQIQDLALIEGDLDETQRATWTASTAEYDQLEAQLAERAERAQRLSNLRDVITETGDGAQAAGEARDVQVQRTQTPDDIYDRSGLHIDNPADGVTYRDRALRAIEGWDRTISAEWRESAERLIDNAPNSTRGRAIADHILRCGSPQYVRAWYKYMSGGIDTMTEAERAALAEGRDRAAMAEGVTTTGGFMVPVFIDPTIILTNTGITNPFRSIAKVISITTQTWKGVTSDGVTAEWTAEAAEMTDASPTVAQPTITPVRADAYVQASWEMLEDTSIATELAMLFADARDRLEGTAFATGTGSTQPQGIVGALQLITASRVNANTNGALGAIDIFALDNDLPPRWRGNASWLANKAYWNRVRQLGTDATGFAFWVDFGGGRPASLIGYPVYESSAMQSTLSSATASNDDVIILGDFRAGYYIVDRIGMSVLTSNGLGVIGTNRRPTGETGFAAFWRVGGDTVIDNAFRMLRL
jgi:HK97 family phage major capsid protein